MNWDTLRLYAAGNDWLALWPELTLVIAALACLLCEVCLPGKLKRMVLFMVFLLAFIVPMGILLAQPFPVPAKNTFAGLLSLGGLHVFARMFFLVCGLGTGLLAAPYLRARSLPFAEFYATLLIVTAALSTLAGSAHFITLFVLLEVVSIGLVILIGFAHKQVRSLEAALKFLILGGVSSALLLLGITLLYGIAGNPSLPGHTAHGLEFAALGNFLALHAGHPIAQLGVVLVVAGLAFKIGFVPFQMWIPDVYQGAPSPVLPMLAVASKAIGVWLLMLLILGPFSAMGAVLVPLLSVLGIATLLFGSLSALTQNEPGRLVGLSGVVHAGYLSLPLVALASGQLESIWLIDAILFYLFAYLLASFCVLGVTSTLPTPPSTLPYGLAQFQGLWKARPFACGILIIGLASLAGIPPVAGFMAKFLLLVGAFQAQLYPLLAAAFVSIVCGFFVYLKWMREAVNSPFEGAGTHPHPTFKQLCTCPFTRVCITAFLTVCAALTVLLGIFPAA